MRFGQDGVDRDVTLIRLVVLVAVIAGAGYAGQLRGAEGVATAAPVRYEIQVSTERFPASALDVREHGRGPVVPASALTGFALPEGFDIPDEPELLPGSERDYRGGYHEGIDFPLAFGMPVVAAKAGTIVRIDSAYTEWTVDEQIAGEDVGYKLGYTPAAILDKLRGHGVVPRHAHLDSVELFSVGSIVEQGTLIGRVGNSGVKSGPHLHIEIRIGDSYLGDGLGGADLLLALHRAFS